MDAIETKTVEHDGQTYRIRIYPDGDALQSARGLGRNGHDPEPEPPARQLRSRRRRGGDRAQPRRRAAQLLRAWAVPLVGRRGIARPLPLPVGFGQPSPASGCPTPRRWNPPATTAAGPASISCGSVPARRATPTRSGATATSTATRSSGSPPARCCGSEQAEAVDSCWGFYGLDTCLSEARSSLGLLDDRPAASTIVSYDTINERPTP